MQIGGGNLIINVTRLFIYEHISLLWHKTAIVYFHHFLRPNKEFAPVLFGRESLHHNLFTQKYSVQDMQRYARNQIEM